jgi:hypothetical protein
MTLEAAASVESARRLCISMLMGQEARVVPRESERTGEVSSIIHLVEIAHIFYQTIIFFFCRKASRFA